MKYAVYVVVVEDTEQADQDLSAHTGDTLWRLAGGIDHETAERIGEEASGMDWGIEP